MTPFTLQAALEALDRSVIDVERAETDCEDLEDDVGAKQANSDAAILRDLRERLAGAYSGVLREEMPGKLVFEPDGAGQRVIVIKVEE